MLCHSRNSKGVAFLHRLVKEGFSEALTVTKKLEDGNIHVGGTEGDRKTTKQQPKSH